ncbi:TPA: ADP-ribosyltransferase [Streptococcus pyogenes]|nr:ADP-ribosyltransferase [Streptococcus pyogenes]
MLKKRYQLAIVLLLSCFSLIWQTEGLVELFVCEHYERAVCEGTPAYFTFSDQKGAETLIKKRWGKGLIYPRAEQEAMAAYTCQQAGPINTSLDKAKGELSQLTPELRDQVAQLDAATHRLVIPWNIVVYRYVYETFLRDIGVSHADLTSYYRNHQFDPHILCKIKLGTRYTKHSFMSTTALKNGAMTHRPVEVRICVKKGAKAAFVEAYSAVPSEVELLFPRGCQLEVVGAYVSQDQKKLHIEAYFKGSL